MASDRIVRIGAIDQLHQRLWYRHRIATGNRIHHRLGTLAATKPARRAVRTCVTSSWSVPHLLFTYGSTTGVQITWSMRGRASRQHHQPVETEGNSAGLRHPPPGGEKILVNWIALAIDTLFFRHRCGRNACAARWHLSARRKRWQVPPRRRKARSALRPCHCPALAAPARRVVADTHIVWSRGHRRVRIDRARPEYG